MTKAALERVTRSAALSEIERLVQNVNNDEEVEKVQELVDRLRAGDFDISEGDMVELSDATHVFPQDLSGDIGTVYESEITETASGYIATMTWRKLNKK